MNLSEFVVGEAGNGAGPVDSSPNGSVFGKYSLSRGYNVESLGKEHGDVTSLQYVQVPICDRQAQEDKPSDLSAKKNVSGDKIKEQIEYINANSKKIGEAMVAALNRTGSSNLGIIGDNGVLTKDDLLSEFKSFVDSVCNYLSSDSYLHDNDLLDALGTFKFFCAGSSVGAFPGFNIYQEENDETEKIKIIFNNLNEFLKKEKTILKTKILWCRSLWPFRCCVV